MLEDMKSHFTFYHVLLMRIKLGNKLMTPGDCIMHTPAVSMINHLVWFLESAVDEDQEEQCHYTPRLYLFTQVVTALWEQISIVGGTRLEQTMEHCRAFSAIAMQLLHDLGVIFLRWIMMGPKTCIGNCVSK
jgi:hypothetical protein